MSNFPATLTRPQRPPFRGGPPIRTTFDAWSNGESEPEYEAYLESAEKLLSTVDSYAVDDLDVLVRLLDQRQSWISSELEWRRFLEPDFLPPIQGFDLKDAFTPTNAVERRLIQMLNRLNEAILKVYQRKWLQKPPFPIPEP